MRKNKYVVFASVLLPILLILPLVNSTVMLTQPEALYNLGEQFSISSTIKPTQDSEGFFIMEIICENEAREIKKEYVSLKANQEKTISDVIGLSKSLLGELKGECFARVSYAGEETISQKFEISDSITVTLELEKFNYNAGEEIIVRGKAIKENGKSVDGFVDISISGTDLAITRPVINGEFKANFTLTKNLASRDYIINAKVYEKDKDIISNQGTSSLSINVRQTANKLEIALDNQNVKPDSILKFKVILYDQANEQVEGDVSVIIKDSNEKEIFKKLIKTNIYTELNLEKNATPGYWEIEAKSSGVDSKRLFYVEESEIAEFKIVQDMLIVTNIGNIPYKKSVQINIGDATEIKELNLDIGESKEFRLIAPDGNYEVSVTDGLNTVSESGIFLTGNIIGVMDISPKNIFSKYPIVWLFLIVVFGLFILMLVERTIKKKVYAYPQEGKIKSATGAKVEKVAKFKTEEKGTKLAISEKPREAEHSLVIHGDKQDVSIVALKIKNLEELKKSKTNAMENIEKTLEKAIEHKGVLFRSNEYLFVIFAPLMTKTFKNDIRAVKLASEIQKALEEHNKKFVQKINYGLAVNSGQMILKEEQGKVKFASLGTTVSLSKRIAELADKEVLISKDANTKVMPEVKSEKKTLQNIDVYKPKEIVEREKYDNFIRDFLRRIEKK